MAPPAVINASDSELVDGDEVVIEAANLPYYLANFMRIVNDVTSSNSQFRIVLLAHELAHVESMRGLSTKAQQLYVRLFLRKPGWLSHAKIKYTEIADDCVPLFAELQKCGLLEDSFTGCALKDMLRLAPNPVLKDVCKQHSIKFTTGEDARKAVTNVALKQKSLWGTSLETAIKKSLRKLMGPAVRLSPEPRECFSRIMALFSLTTSTFDSVFEVNSTSVGPMIPATSSAAGSNNKRSRNSGIHPVFGMLLSDIGNHKYPSIDVSATRPIFRTRAHLERFEHAQRLEMTMFDAWTQKNISGMMEICRSASKLFKQYELDGFLADDEQQPLHLRNMSAGWRLVRVIEVGVEAFQRAAYQNKTALSKAAKRKIEDITTPEKQTAVKTPSGSKTGAAAPPIALIELDDDGTISAEANTQPNTQQEQLHAALEAIHILEDVLLRQKFYCMHHRGDWYERLALIYERYHPESSGGTSMSTRKQRERALDVVETGLRDEHVRMHQRYVLTLRRDRLWKQLNNNQQAARGASSAKKVKSPPAAEAVNDSDQYFPNNNKSVDEVRKLNTNDSTCLAGGDADAGTMLPCCGLKEAVKIFIEGRRIPQEHSGVTRSIFVRVTTETTDAVAVTTAPPADKSSPTKSVSVEDLIATQIQQNVTNLQTSNVAAVEMLCSVEQFTLAHFRDNGFPCGLHAEGSVIRTVIGLTFWDVVFAPLEAINNVPDSDAKPEKPLESIFCSAFQLAPLDLLAAERNYFVRSRRHLVEARLQQLRSEWSGQDFKNFIRTVWEAHFQTMCVFVNWELFESLEQLFGLLDCLELRKFAELCDYFLRDARCLSAGFPDLICWNPKTGALKIVEVKGPGDTLSAKQIVWLDFLLRTGFDACVCHVRVSGSGKELKKAVVDGIIKEEAVEVADETKAAASSSSTAQKNKKPAARHRATTSGATKSRRKPANRKPITTKSKQTIDDDGNDSDIICLD